MNRVNHALVPYGKNYLVTNLQSVVITESLLLQLCIRSSLSLNLIIYSHRMSDAQQVWQNMKLGNSMSFFKHERRRKTLPIAITMFITLCPHPRG